jgi:hypothetical protein
LPRLWRLEGEPVSETTVHRFNQVAVNAEGRLIAWVPGRLRNPLNAGKGEHWSATARERKAWRERTFLCVKSAMNESKWRYGAGWPKLVVFTAYVWNLYDDDGLSAALKSVRDGLVDAGILNRDDPKSGHKFEYRQQIERSRHRGVEIVVEPGR